MSSEQPTTTAGNLISLSVTIAAALVLLMTVSLLNLPGERVCSPSMAWGKYGPHFDGDEEHLEHGWPLTAWRREAERNWTNAPPYTLYTTYTTVGWNWLAAFVDAVVAAMIVAGGLWLFQLWRIRRQHLFQLYLWEIFVLTGAVACATSWLLWVSQTYAEEERIVQDLKLDPHQCQRLQGGPWWLRERCEWLSIFDRVYRIRVEGRDLPKVSGLRSLQVISLNGDVTEEELRSLEALPRLEGLDLIVVYCRHDRRERGDDEPPPPRPVSLPKLPCLRGLNLFDVGPIQGVNGANLPSLEALDLTGLGGVEVDDEYVESLCGLKHLRELAIDANPQQVLRLRKALPRCRINFDP